MKRLANWSAGLVLLLFAVNAADAQQPNSAAIDKEASSGSLSVIAPLPTGTSTILGGSIQDVDPVLDRFTLKITGEKPMRILFDGRTQVFLDGKRVSLRELHAAQHASVQTVLDDTSVFALSIHILSQLQQGDYRGEVASFNPGTGELAVVSGKGGEPVNLHVSSNTRFSRKGQTEFAAGSSSAADLQRGALVSIRFEPDGKGHGSAEEITFLATPGSRFEFAGNVIALDLHSGTMALLDPRDHQTYEIAVSPGTPGVQDLRSGQRVRVTAEYDGTHYRAQNVTVY